MTQTATSRDADPALAARVRRTLGAPGSGPLTVLEGGRSGLTYVIADGTTRRVVKAVPPGSRAVGRNDVLRQSHILSALSDLTGSDVPVPRVIARDAEEPAWFAMEFAEGAALEPVLDPAGALSTEAARRRMLTAAAVLGRLHAIPLADLAVRLRAAGGELPAAADPADELVRWTRTMHAVPEELRSGSAELLAALAANVPPPVAPVLVHGDFRLGNLMFAEETPTALVDWEIWGVGDPRVDLGWFGVFTDGDLFPGIGRTVPGLPSEDDLAAAYRDARGTDGGTTSDAGWFRALGRMKMAAIMGHNLRRHREGRHHDPVQEQLPPTIAALIASGLELVA